MNSEKLNTYVSSLIKYINSNKGPNNTIMEPNIRSQISNIITLAQDETSVEKIRLKFIKEGALVTYVPMNGDFARGVVKKVDEDMTSAWVVFQCSGNWENYKDYTPQRVEFKLLRDGWK